MLGFIGDGSGLILHFLIIVPDSAIFSAFMASVGGKGRQWFNKKLEQLGFHSDLEFCVGFGIDEFLREDNSKRIRACFAGSYRFYARDSAL